MVILASNTKNKKSMSIKKTFIALAILVTILAASLFILVGGGESKAPTYSPDSTAKAAQPPKSVLNLNPPNTAFTGNPQAISTPPKLEEITKRSERDSVLVSISDLSSSITEESVKTVTPYLASPDLEVRNAAIEAMKQISLPSAAKALREAANKSTSPADKVEFTKAAEFIDLPPYIPFKDRKD
jgi:hypothetical protein